MSWNDYHLNSPFFCTPLPVMRGLVSAACERREAVDAEFHASCVSSGASAVAETRLAEMLFCSSAGEIPFKEIRKEYLSFAPYGNGVSGYYSFMHMFDAFLGETLAGGGEFAGYGYRTFTDSTGSRTYDSQEGLASALCEPLIAPHSFDSSAANADCDFHVVLNASWASQRTRMLKMLRYVDVSRGGFAIRRADIGRIAYGPTPQSAYDAISSWTFSETVFTGWENPLDCRVEYQYNAWDIPEERWAFDFASEITRITPVFDGCLETASGRLSFDADDLRERDKEGHIVENTSETIVFDPLCTGVSSGANTLLLSNGCFASRGYGSASAFGGPETSAGRYVRGWQARNVKVVYDYESTFNFKQGE